MSTDGLAVIHVDGVGFDVLQRALERGTMPFIRGLLNDGYTVQRYRSGVPSTTPYCQAGILYGDNRDIAGFRWYDKQAGVPIRFGVGASFKQVAHRYFRGREGLATGGASIAACYPGGADRTFGIAFKDRKHGLGRDEATRLLGRFLLDPRNLTEIAWHAAYTTMATTAEYLQQRLRRQHPAVAYAATDILEEMFVHDLTRSAVQRAMNHGEPVIYAGFYAYDEAAHGFGPDDAFSVRMLRHVDQTLRTIFKEREKLAAVGQTYEVVILSDHGQTRARSLQSVEGRSLPQLLSEWLPRVKVEDLKGKSFGPRGDALDGDLRLDQAADLLAAFDAPEVLIRQLRKLNSFETAGDLIVFGRWDGTEQINFETQVGGHGSIGGEQNHPFLLARSNLGLRVEGMTDASELYGVLRALVPG